MFTSAWFWLTFSAFFLISNYWYMATRERISSPYGEKMCGISLLGLIIYWIIGLFCAEEWWHPLVGSLICFFLSGIVGVILPRKVNKIAAIIGPAVSVALTFAAYIIWYK